jgi:hypothetical protein
MKRFFSLATVVIFLAGAAAGAVAGLSVAAKLHLEQVCMGAAADLLLTIPVLKSLEQGNGFCRKLA